MSNVIVITNYWGGIPSSLIKKSLFSIPNFKMFSNGGTCVTNAYVTNTDAKESFKDFISNKCLNGFPINKKETMFHLFKNAGYKTVVLGSFGLEKSLDPNPVRREYQKDSTYSLMDYGIDIFSEQDGCFDVSSAYAHDKRLVLEAMDLLNLHDSEQKLLLFLNLKGCHDCYHRRFDDAVKKQQLHGIDKKNWFTNPDVNDVRLVPLNVQQQVEALKPIIMASNQQQCLFYGETGKTSIDARIKFLSLQQSAWNDLNKIDFYLTKLNKIIKEKYTKATTCVIATNVISLEEHGVRKDLPTDSCSRTFWCISKNEFDRPPEEVTAPESLLSFWSNFVDITKSERITTLCLVPTTNLDSKTTGLRTVLNMNGKTYSVTYMWSLRELIDYTNDDDSALIQKCFNKTQWSFTKSNILSVFDLTEDPDEVYNIVNICSERLITYFNSNFVSFNAYMKLNNHEEYERSKATIERVTKQKNMEKESKQTNETKQPSRTILSTRPGKASSKQVLDRTTSTLSSSSLVLDTPKADLKTDYNINTNKPKVTLDMETSVSQASITDSRTDEESVGKNNESSEELKKNLYSPGLKKKIRFNPNPTVYELKSVFEKSTKPKISQAAVAALRKRENDLNLKHR